MDREQFESAYYAWFRADCMYRPFIQLYDSKMAIKTYHDILATPEGAYLYTWHGLLYALLRFLVNFDDGIPISIQSEVKVFLKPLGKFRNAIFHIHNHPFSESQDDILKLPHAINRVEHIHHEIGKYLSSSYGWPYPPYVLATDAGGRGHFVVPIVSTSSDKKVVSGESESN